MDTILEVVAVRQLTKYNLPADIIVNIIKRTKHEEKQNVELLRNAYIDALDEMSNSDQNLYTPCHAHIIYIKKQPLKI